MGCPTSVELGNSLTFSVATHDPDTGVLSDADAVPSYRVYETETATPILTGVMAKLDDANTTGFYTETIDCTTANGFENGKSYTIYIEATIDSDTGGITYGFTVNTKTGYALAAAGLDAIVIETGMNARQAMSIITSALAGILSGAATTTIVIKAAQEGTTTRVIATVDSDGNRSAVTLNLPS